MSSKQKTKSNQNNSWDPLAHDTWQGVAQPILDYSHQPVTAYGGELSAGLDPLQTQAAGMAGANVGAGQGALNGAIGTAGQVAGYQPGQVQAGQVGGMDLSGYMNPYINSVLDSGLNRLDEFRQREMVGNSEAAGPGAWGGARHGVADSLTNENFNDQASSFISSILQGGYDRATGLAQGDIDRMLGADQFNVSSGLQGQGLNLNAANAQAAMGQQQQTMGQSDASFLNQFGTQQQQNSQQALDAAYQDYLRQQQQAMAQQGLGLGVLGSIPGITDSHGSTTSTSYPGAAGIVGAGLNLASMFFNPLGAAAGGGMSMGGGG